MPTYEYRLMRGNRIDFKFDTLEKALNIAKKYKFLKIIKFNLITKQKETVKL